MFLEDHLALKSDMINVVSIFSLFLITFVIVYQLSTTTDYLE